MTAPSRNSWVCGPPQNRDPIVLAIIGVLWGPRNGPDCEIYAAPIPQAPTAMEIAAVLLNQYPAELVYDRLRLWTRRGLFKGVPCVGDEIDNPEVRYEINPVAAEVNRQNWLYLSPNAIIPVTPDINLCCFNPCVSKKGSIASVDNYRFVQQPVLTAVQRQRLLDRRNPATTPCGQINCREGTENL